MAKLSRLLRTTIVTVLLSVVSALPASAQPQPQATKRPMTLMDLAELRRIGVGTTQLSPDGRTLVYMLSTTDWKSGRSIYHLWKQNVGGGAPTQLTFTETGDIPAGVRWSPDGKTLLFMRDGQIWLLPADGGEPRALTKHATNVSQPAWTPDGATVYFLASDPQTPDERERTRLRDDVRGFEEDYKQRRLWKIVVSTGAETQLTSGDFTVMEYRLSTDGKRMAMQRAPSPLSGDAYRGEVWVMDANAENARVLTSNAIEEFGLELSPDNSQILFRGDAGDQFEPTYNTRSEEHTSELQSHRDLHSFPTRRSSDLHEQRDRGVRPRAVARQLADPVPGRRRRSVRADVQHEPVGGAGGRRHAARGAAGLRLLDRVGDMVARRPLDLPHREHGRAQRVLPGRRRRAARAADDRRRALHSA